MSATRRSIFKRHLNLQEVLTQHEFYDQTKLVTSVVKVKKFFGTRKNHVVVQNCNRKIHAVRNLLAPIENLCIVNQTELFEGS